MVNLYIQFLYDKEIDLGGRFKETMALGLTYKFIKQRSDLPPFFVPLSVSYSNA